MEILAPAGNAECAEAALKNGADAIYLGFSTFSARQGAENFDETALGEVIASAHFRGAKVYVAMNTVVKDGEIDAFLRTLLCVWNMGADAIILQDALLGKVIHRAYPQIVLHLSTQAGVCTVEGAIFAKDCGFSRVIVARETPIAEIKKIAEIIETEAFVQGALCTCFSGQCYFSSFAGGNSGNRGRCKQPCRKLYRYNRAGREELCYALSLSDLCVGEDIEKLVNAGVVSFKIEGRMRRKEYVAAAVRYYRGLLDKNSTATALSDLKRTYNRGNYTKGLAFGQDKRFLSTAVQGHIGEKLGVVKVVNGEYIVECAFQPRTGDAFKILRDGKEVGGANFVKVVKRGFAIGSSARLKNGDGVFITTDTAVNERVLTGDRQGRVRLCLEFKENEFPLVSGGGVTVRGEERLQTANSRPLTVEELKESFMKTDGLPIEIVFEKVTLAGDIFIPKSKLNAFRRAFFQALRETVTKNGNPEYGYTALPVKKQTGTNGKIAVMASDFVGINADIAIYKPDDYAVLPPESYQKADFEKYLYYPAFLTSEDIAKMEEYIHAFDGVYIENYGGIAFAKKHGLKIFAGTGLNLCNAVAVENFMQMENARYYALSKELNAKESRALAGESAFVLSAGDLKVMDLIYCPFGKTCKNCDKRRSYTLTDEQNRVFPVRRYLGGDGNCRFEVYNCVALIGAGVDGAGKLLDLSVFTDKQAFANAVLDTEKQKRLCNGAYTSGHANRGVL